MKLIKNTTTNKKFLVKNYVKNITKKEKGRVNYPYKSLDNMKSGEIFSEKNNFVNDDIKSDLIPCRKNDILYGKCRPKLDKCILMENKEGYTTGEVLVYRTDYYKFFVNLFHSKKFIEHNIKHATGAKMPRTSNKNVMNFSFELNDEKEIVNIGNFLYEKRKKINNLEKLIEKLEKRNQYYANKLLTGELRVKEDANGNIEFYKNPEDNWKEEKVNGYLHKTPMKMPKDWKINLASSYSRFIVGTPLNSKFFNFEQKGLQYLRTADVWEDASSKKEKAFYDGKNIESKFIKNENDFIISLKGYNTKVGQGTLGLVTSFENKKGIICDNMYVVKSIDKISLNDYTSFVFKNIYIQNLIIRCAVRSTARFSTKMINKKETEKLILVFVIE